MKQISANGGYSVILLVIIVFVFSAFLLSTIASNYRNKSTPQNELELPDVSSTVKISEIRKLQTGMEIYATEWGTYPPVGQTCVSVAILEEYLVPEYLESVPNSQQYTVAVSNDGYRFVLRTALGLDSFLFPDTDKNGTILGCDCNDPYFCATEYQIDEEEFREKYGEPF